jgi:hypothetical protein
MHLTGMVARLVTLSRLRERVKNLDSVTIFSPLLMLGEGLGVRVGSSSLFYKSKDVKWVL